nr:DNA helicase [Tanacetum cinerariifolium]
MREKESNEFTNSGLNQLEKQPPYILTHIQNPATLEALDNVRIRYASSCNVPSIEAPTGVSVLPFGAVFTSEGIFNLWDIPSANCPSQNTQLYLDVFQKCFEFCGGGGNLRRERTTTFRVVCHTEDTKLYLDVYQKYFQSCREISREQPNMIFKDVRNIGPSIPHRRRNTRANPKVTSTTGEATRFRDIVRRHLVNVPQSTTVSNSNFIHNNVVFFFADVPNTGPSVPCHSRNTRANPKVTSTIGEATILRRVRRRPSTRAATVSSSSAAGVGNSYTYTNFGDSNQCCRHCGTSFWYGERLKYDLIFRGGILFQQYVIVVFCTIEQNRLDFIRKKQNDIRADYLSGLYDAISQGERDGHKVGGRIILPMSFTDGPRYMYAHYLDALAIFRKLGNLQFFITLTCNVNWPEIKRFMAEYSEFTTSDKADVVCQIRFVFSHILLHSNVADPSKLWTKYWEQMSNDIPKKVSKKVQIRIYHLNADSQQGYTLYELEIILNNCGKSLQSFGLPPPPTDLLGQLANRLLMEERNYNREELIQLKNDSVLRLNTDQKSIYELIINDDANSRQELIFVYGYGGTGKTFLWKTIISSLRLLGKIVLAVASSADTDLIIWDDAPMNDRRCFEVLNRSLRDIINRPSLFRGKSIMLGGDFMQTFPVKKGASKTEVIASCISESALWPSFKVLTLKQNMRLSRPDITLEERSLVNSFSSWLLDIGDGKTGRPIEEDPENTSWIDIPATYCLPPDEQGLSKLVDFVYDQSTLHTPSAITLQQKAIVCPKNETADIINSKVLNMVHSESTSYMSQDEA